MRSAVLLFAAFALCAAAMGVPAAGSAPPAADGGSAGHATAPNGVPTATGSAEGTSARRALRAVERSPETELRIDLRANGDAVWTVTVRYELGEGTTPEAFDAFAAAFENGEYDIGYGAGTFENFAGLASEATGREMAVEDVSRSSEREDGEGRLSVSFVWTNFLGTDGDRLVLERAFETPDGETWLGSLGPDQRLVIEPPEGHAIESTTYPFESNVITIEGPWNVQERPRIRVTYAPTSGPVPFLDAPWGPLAVLVVLGTVAAALVITRRGASGEPGPATGASDEREAPATGESDEPEVDPSLLSDEERVERLIERNGGRMRQAEIVRETDWSDAKVSQLLSTMAEDGRVEKLRLGRENLISLPDGDDADRPSGEADSRRDE